MGRHSDFDLQVAERIDRTEETPEEAAAALEPDPLARAILLLGARIGARVGIHPDRIHVDYDACWQQTLARAEFAGPLGARLTVAAIVPDSHPRPLDHLAEAIGRRARHEMEARRDG